MATNRQSLPDPTPHDNKRAAATPTPRARLENLARRYYGPLVSFFRKRTGNSTEVQDLVQQVFLRLAQYRALGSRSSSAASDMRSAHL